MNPPIPDPESAPRVLQRGRADNATGNRKSRKSASHVLQRGPRPATMKYFMAGALFFTLTGFIYCDGSMTEYSVLADLIVYTVQSAVWLTILGLLWSGRNWPRIVYMVLCGFGVLSVFWMGDRTLLQKALTIVEAAFSGVWFWWLQTPEVVAFTKGKPAVD